MALWIPLSSILCKKKSRSILDFLTTEIPPELQGIVNLKTLYYSGNLGLLTTRKITILGTRNPNPYAQNFTQTIAKKLSQKGITIVSGGALGVDIIAHSNSLPHTIMVSPASLDIIYPKSNAKVIQQIYTQGLVLSQFDPPYTPYTFSFLERNKLVVSLGECVIIPQADLRSGSMQSAHYALSVGKQIFVPPHHIGQSQGTQSLAKNGKAQVIWDIDAFVESLELPKCDSKENVKTQEKDEVLEFCKGNPLFDEAFLRFGAALFEYELEGKIQRKNGRVEVV